MVFPSLFQGVRDEKYSLKKVKSVGRMENWQVERVISKDKAANVPGNVSSSVLL